MKPPTKIMMEHIKVYKHYEYESSPLFILCAGGPGSRVDFPNAADILATLDEWYGNTEQETTDWALEFEVWARSLLLDGGLVLNPKHLALDEVMDEFLELLGDMPQNLRARYERMSAVDMNALQESWEAAGKPGCFDYVTDKWFGQEG